MPKVSSDKIRNIQIKSVKRKVGIDFSKMMCVEYKEKFSNDTHTAILHSSNSHIYKFLVVRESVIDGVEYVDKKQIKKIDSISNYTKFINNCIDRKLLHIPKMSALRETDVLKSVLKDQKSIIGIDTIYKKELIFLVGRVGAFTKNGFEIECVDQQGNVDDHTYHFKYSEVARVAVGGNYLKMLNKFRKVVG